MNPHSHALPTSDGSHIFTQYWLTEMPPKAAVILSHGLGEHSGRYDHVARMLLEEEYAFFGFDHRGHGKSTGKRGHIPDYEVLMEELDIMFGFVRETLPGTPIFLYGHSWGGNIALNYLLRRKSGAKGAIVSGAWLKLPQDPPLHKQYLAKVMNVIYPPMTENNGIDPKLLSRDKTVVEDYENDPLVHPKISARLFLATEEAAEWALTHAGELSVPILFMHGKDDQITSPLGTKAFAAKVKAPKVVRIYDGFRHEVHNEPEKQKVFNDMLDFMAKNRL